LTDRAKNYTRYTNPAAVLNPDSILVPIYIWLSKTNLLALGSLIFVQPKASGDNDAQYGHPDCSGRKLNPMDV